MGKLIKEWYLYIYTRRYLTELSYEACKVNSFSLKSGFSAVSLPINSWNPLIFTGGGLTKQLGIELCRSEYKMGHTQETRWPRQLGWSLLKTRERYSETKQKKWVWLETKSHMILKSTSVLSLWRIINTIRDLILTCTTVTDSLLHTAGVLDLLNIFPL